MQYECSHTSDGLVLQENEHVSGRAWREWSCSCFPSVCFRSFLFTLWMELSCEQKESLARHAPHIHLRSMPNPYENKVLPISTIFLSSSFILHCHLVSAFSTGRLCRSPSSWFPLIRHISYIMCMVLLL